MANDSGPQFGWRKGDALTADNLNRNSGWQNLTVGPGLTMARMGNAVSIALASKGGASTFVTVKISSIISGQIGRYNAKTIAANASAGATGNLAETDLGTLAGSEDSIVWHVPEIKLASAKHLLIADAHYVGRIAGTASNGKPIILIDALPVGETASPTTLGAASEGSESADSTTWSRATNGTPLTVYIQTRTAFYHAGDEKLYGYFRLFTYDSCGLLISVSAETRVEIDAPEGC